MACNTINTLIYTQPTRLVQQQNPEHQMQQSMFISVTEHYL